MYGHEFCNYLKYGFAPTGISDLVVYFLRRAFSLIRRTGFFACITTNSIKDGDVRTDGLERIISNGGTLCMAVRNIKWPGEANLVVSLLSLHGNAVVVPKFIDGNTVSHISAFLEDEVDELPPVSLDSSGSIASTGTYFLGDGFLLTQEEAEKIISEDPQSRSILVPIVNARDLNSSPTNSPSRTIINFGKMTEGEASGYHQAFRIVLERVKPERDRQSDEGARTGWWQFMRPRHDAYSRLVGLEHCFVAARTTKYHAVVKCPTEWQFSDATNFFTTDRWDFFAIVQSTLHESWARKYSGALKQDLRYSPSKCFDTFAFPGQLWRIPSPELAAIGELYHKHRRFLMLSLWLGLTDIYNLFHSKELEADLKKHYAARAKKDPHGLVIPEEHRATALKSTYEQALSGVLELRRLHVELDNAVLAAYGWHEQSEDGAPIVLAHDFYEVDTLPENDRTRFTIAPVARKELLARLLKENHRRAAAEAATAPLGTDKPARKSGKQKTGEADAGPLFR